MSGVEEYNLYGESGDFPDVVHCETIETRSRVHDWEFKPHRHMRLHQILLVETGGGTAVVEDDKLPLAPGTLVNVPMGTVHGYSFEPDTSGWVVTLASELLEQGLLDSEGLRPMLRTPVLLRSNVEIKQVVQFIFAEYPTRSFARAHVLRALSAALTGLVAREISVGGALSSRGEQTLPRRFEALLEENFHTHMGVAEYSRRLGVTPTHLSRVMRAASGMSAASAIEARLIREARRNLAFSNLRISEIAYQLGFVDPAYFSRAFKRATGVSPRDFRSNLEG